MTLEQTIYEYKPYAMAFLGLYASTQLNSGLGSTSGYALLMATSLIALARYNYRYLDKKTRKKGTHTKYTANQARRKRYSNYYKIK